MTKSSAITHDSIAMRGAGIVQIAQPVTGHRFTVDSILLADFCRVKPKERILEPGAGTGIISLLLAKKFPRSLFSPVEVQDTLWALCEENRKTNELSNVKPICADIRDLSRSLQPRPFEVIVVNPPYCRTGTGRTSPDPGRKIARQDLLAKIGLWLDLQKFLKLGGRYNIVFPAPRLADLLSLMRARKLEPKRMRTVHPYADRPASLVLVEAAKGRGSGLEVMPPLIVHGGDGNYTGEMQDIYGFSSET
jgi:tRNA1Val (adenine37-N6)-methyltransferase